MPPRRPGSVPNECLEVSALPSFDVWPPEREVDHTPRRHPVKSAASTTRTARVVPRASRTPLVSYVSRNPCGVRASTSTSDCEASCDAASFMIHSRGFPLTFQPRPDDVWTMNNSDRPALHLARRPVHPAGYDLRRLFSRAVVGAAIAGLVSAALLEFAGLPEPVVVGAGLIVAWTVATGLAPSSLKLHRPEGAL